MTNEEFFNNIKSGEITQDMFDVLVEHEKQKSFTEGRKFGYVEGYQNGICNMARMDVQDD